MKKAILPGFFLSSQARVKTTCACLWCDPVQALNAVVRIGGLDHASGTCLILHEHGLESQNHSSPAQHG